MFIFTSYVLFRKASPMWEEFVANATKRKALKNLQGNRSEAELHQRLVQVLRGNKR